MNKDETEIHNILSAINDAWRNGRPEEMKSYLHPNIVMKFPGFSREITSSKNLIESFKRILCKR